MKRVVYGILVIIWMITVYMFSNQNGEESKGISDVITNEIVEVADDYLAVGMKTNSVSFLVRKFAHFSIYFIGGFLIYNFVNTFSFRNLYIIIISIVFGVIFAISDEFHQSFIDGRSSQMMDVVIDSCGLIISIIARKKLIDEIEEEKWKRST